MNITDALNDPKLLGGMLDGPTWHPWRVCLKTMFALPLDAAEMATFRHHTGRQNAPTVPSRYVEMVVGRRGGKSRTLGVTASFLACIPDHAPYLVPGETPVVAVIAKDRQQAQIVMGYILGTIRSSPLLSKMIVEVLAESVRLSNGVVIEVATASVGAPRGRTYVAVLCDECAFWPSGDSANPDEEVINAVRPGLTTIKHSMLLIASSPYAKRGVLYTNYAKYFGKDDAPVLVWQGATEEMNATLVGDPLIAEMFETDPERASAEFGAQFRSDIVAFITREAVEDCLARDVREIPPSSGITYVGHVDPSGGSADSFTLAIAYLSEDGKAILAAVREVKPPFSPDAVVMEYAVMLKSYGIARVTGDAYAGEWPRERFAVHGITYDVSRKSAPTIYGEFLPALNAKRVQLLDLPRLVGQLVGLERRVARGGRDSISHSPGSHDDVANAACGALVQVISDRRPGLISAASLTKDGQPVPMPTRCQAILAALALGADGAVAVVYASYWPQVDPPLLIVDFDVGPADGGTLARVALRLKELSRECGAYYGSIGCIMPNTLHVQARHAGLKPHPIGDLLVVTPELALAVATFVAKGSVKLAEPVVAKAESSPFAGALDFRAGDALDSPLRTALLQLVGASMAELRR